VVSSFSNSIVIDPVLTRGSFMLILLAHESQLVNAQDICTELQGELLQPSLVMPRLKSPAFHSTIPGGAHASSFAMVIMEYVHIFLPPTTPRSIDFQPLWIPQCLLYTGKFIAK